MDTFQTGQQSASDCEKVVNSKSLCNGVSDNTVHMNGSIKHGNDARNIAENDIENLPHTNNVVEERTEHDNLGEVDNNEANLCNEKKVSTNFALLQEDIRGNNAAKAVEVDDKIDSCGFATDLCSESDKLSEIGNIMTDDGMKHNSAEEIEKLRAQNPVPTAKHSVAHDCQLVQEDIFNNPKHDQNHTPDTKMDNNVADEGQMVNINIVDSQQHAKKDSSKKIDGDSISDNDTENDKEHNKNSMNHNGENHTDTRCEKKDLTEKLQGNEVDNDDDMLTANVSDGIENVDKTLPNSSLINEDNKEDLTSPVAVNAADNFDRRDSEKDITIASLELSEMSDRFGEAKTGKQLRDEEIDKTRAQNPIPANKFSVVHDCQLVQEETFKDPGHLDNDEIQNGDTDDSQRDTASEVAQINIKEVKPTENHGGINGGSETNDNNDDARSTIDSISSIDIQSQVNTPRSTFAAEIERRVNSIPLDFTDDMIPDFSSIEHTLDVMKLTSYNKIIPNSSLTIKQKLRQRKRHKNKTPLEISLLRSGKVKAYTKSDEEDEESPKVKPLSRNQVVAEVIQQTINEPQRRKSESGISEQSPREVNSLRSTSSRTSNSKHSNNMSEKDVSLDDTFGEKNEGIISTDAPVDINEVVNDTSADTVEKDKFEELQRNERMNESSKMAEENESLNVMFDEPIVGDSTDENRSVLNQSLPEERHNGSGSPEHSSTHPSPTDHNEVSNHQEDKSQSPLSDTTCQAKMTEQESDNGTFVDKKDRKVSVYCVANDGKHGILIESPTLSDEHVITEESQRGPSFKESPTSNPDHVNHQEGKCQSPLSDTTDLVSASHRQDLEESPRHPTSFSDQTQHETGAFHVDSTLNDALLSDLDNDTINGEEDCLHIDQTAADINGEKEPPNPSDEPLDRHEQPVKLISKVPPMFPRVKPTQLKARQIHTATTRTGVKPQNAKQREIAIRERLRCATQACDREELESAIHDFRLTGMSDEQGELTTACAQLDLIKTSDSLNDALFTRNMERLKYALVHSERMQYQDILKKDIQKAKEMLNSHARVTKLKRNVVAMDVTQFAEIRRYQKPHPLVHKVVRATLLLLGESEAKTRVWKRCQSLLCSVGPKGFFGRIQSFQVDDLAPQIVSRSNQLLAGISVVELHEASRGIPVVHDWVVGMIQEYENRNGMCQNIKPATRKQQRRILRIMKRPSLDMIVPTSRTTSSRKQAPVLKLPVLARFATIYQHTVQDKQKNIPTTLSVKSKTTLSRHTSAKAMSTGNASLLNAQSIQTARGPNSSQSTPRRDASYKSIVAEPDYSKQCNTCNCNGGSVAKESGKLPCVFHQPTQAWRDEYL